jgi:hypothetical protein
MSILQKITDTTKVREWVERINVIIDELTLKSYVWESVSKKGVATYTFSKPFPVNSKFVVTYASIELYEGDYEMDGVYLTFVNGAPLEDGYPIKIRYIGSK